MLICVPSNLSSPSPNLEDSNDDDITIGDNEDEYAKFKINRVPISPHSLLYDLSHPTRVQVVSTHTNHTKRH